VVPVLRVLSYTTCNKTIKKIKLMNDNKNSTLIEHLRTVINSRCQQFTEIKFLGIARFNNFNFTVINAMIRIERRNMELGLSNVKRIAY